MENPLGSRGAQSFLSLPPVPPNPPRAWSKALQGAWRGGDQPQLGINQHNCLIAQ